MIHEYLQLEVFHVRQAAAAWFLRNYPAVVEFGGGPTPLIGAWQMPCIVHGRYGFCALGLDPRPDTDWDNLYAMARNSSRAVLETAIDWSKGQGNLEVLITAVGRPVLWTVDFDLGNNPIPEQSNGLLPRTRRRMVVL